MPDIFLYAGELNPSDIVLRDPTVAAGGGTQTFTYSATGGIVFAGASEVVKGKTFTASGGISFNGSASIATSHAYTVSGGITFGGQSTSFSPPPAPAPSAGGGFYSRRTRPFVCDARGRISFAGTAASAFVAEDIEAVTLALLLMED
jgi:hypothetical protein